MDDMTRAAADRFRIGYLPAPNARLPLLARVERATQPLQLPGVNRDHVEPAGRRRGEAQQVVARRQHQAGLLGLADAGGGAAMADIGSRTHFNKDQGTVALAQDQVDLAAAGIGPARDPIIALDQHHPLAQQMGKRLRLCRLAKLLPVD